MVISRLPSGGGGSKELHGAVISVTFGDRFTGSSCELLKGSESIKTVAITSTHLIEFKDILDVGTYTVKLIADSTEYTKEIEITAEDILNKVTKSLAFKGANISVLVGDSLSGATTTISFGGEVLKTATMPSTKTLLFDDLLSVGAYEVACEKGTISRTESVNITADNITLGETVSVEFTGASILVATEDSGMIGKTVSLSFGSTVIQSKLFNDSGTCLFTDIQEVGTYTVSVEDFTENTVISADDIKNKNTIEIDITTEVKLILGNTYSLGGYDWTCAEDKGNYYVLQSQGVTNGGAGSIFNSTSSDQAGVDNHSKNPILNSLYSNISKAEYKSASFGRGLYFISNAQYGTTTHLTPGHGLYRDAMFIAGNNYKKFGAGYYGCLLGTRYSANNFWYTRSDTDGTDYAAYNGQLDDNFVVAPAFNIDPTKIILSGNTILVRS